MGGRFRRWVWVVLDTSGAGRVVGVFDSKALADEVVGPFASYYKVHRAAWNAVEPAVLPWAQTATQRAHLARFARPGGGGND